MDRSIDILTEREELNEWVLKSIKLFEETPYLDNVLEVYPLETAKPERLEARLRRRIILAHQGRKTDELIRIFLEEVKFPYEEPLWFLMKNAKGARKANPKQLERIMDSLYAMTAEETVIRLEAAPKLNTQMGHMFSDWLKRSFKTLEPGDFQKANGGIFILNASEVEGMKFVNQVLGQELKKRPDLVAKVNQTYVIGEAKWIGSPGGNQEKQVVEVLDFCREQRGAVMRVGIIDGFPWAVQRSNDKIINAKEAVQVQESPYDVLSALLLKEYLESLL